MYNRTKQMANNIILNIISATNLRKIYTKLFYCIYSGHMAYKITKKTVKRRPISKALTVRKVAQIAKRVTLKQSETKSAISSNFLDPLDNNYQVQNLVYFITQGDDGDDMIGKKMHVNNIRINGFIQHTNNGSASKFCRIVVFRTKSPLTATKTNLTKTDLFRSGGTTYVPTDHIDLHKVDVLLDKRITVTPTISGTVRQGNQVAMNVRIDKDEWFDADNSGYLKGKNYYVAFGCYSGEGGVTAPAAFTYTWAVNFKDS